MLVRPPEHVGVGELFRLLAAPSPRYPIAHRLGALPGLPLYARALAPLDSETLRDAARGAPKGADAVAYAQGLFAAAVVTADGSPVFASEEHAGMLDETEALALYGALRAALDIVAPEHATAHVGAWKAALVSGARQNLAIASRMYSAADVALGYGVSMRMPRADRYWGKPLCDLTEGQMMAFSAAVEVIAALVKDS